MYTVSHFLLHAFLFFLILLPKQLWAEPVGSDEEIFKKLDDLTTLRETLSSSLENRPAPIDENTFAQTCMPIGKELKRWAQEHGYEARQISHKNRNPQNAVLESDRETYDLFLENPEKNTHTSAPPSESAATSYYARIPYVASCGNCHGSKNSRPEFVVQKYPTDSAYDFQVGDLRGIYVIRKPATLLEADERAD